MTLESRIELIAAKIDKWLNLPDSSLAEAAKETYLDGYFQRSDISYALQCLKERISKEKLKKWVEKAGLTSINKNPHKVLCLHAGNLPLVGFQDALAVLLSGHDYYGKISRKDPYLLPAFLAEFKDTELGNSIHWDTELLNFKNLDAGAITFSGSESSIPSVMEVINSNHIASERCNYLIRKAHFSIAYLDLFNNEDVEDLVNAILRYDGKGCRSVAIVVSPLKLNRISCSFTDYFESYWTHNPTYRKPSPKIKYRYAYNKAVDKPQMLLEHLIIEESDDPMLDDDNVIYWVPGDIGKMKELADQYGDQVQNLYVTSGKNRKSGFEDKMSYLSEAQCPPINWKPDGIDILEWLSKQ